MSVSVRQAKEFDVPVLEELFHSFSEWELERAESIQKAVKDPNGELLVAELKGSVIAFLHQVFYNDPLHAGLCSTITNLFVKKEYRRSGIASELLRRALESAKRRNVKEVHVTTRKNNTDALRLYLKSGFREEGILLEFNP